jgi:nucleoside-diphosphate-sugar epimerase
MDVLITGAASELGQEVVRALSGQHRLRLQDTVEFEVPDKCEQVLGNLLDAEIAWSAVRGMEAIVHTAALPHGLPAGGHEREQALLEWFTRGTHVLLKAAAEARVRSCVYASTLEIFRTYPDDVYISENWRPLPSPEMETMGRYLGELVCREFARDHRMGNTALRLGRLVREEDAEGMAADLMWLDPRDAAQAFACALGDDLSQEIRGARRWRVLHVCADIPNPKFLVQRARATGYAPTHDFSAHWAQGEG